MVGKPLDAAIRARRIRWGVPDPDQAEGSVRLARESDLDQVLAIEESWPFTPRWSRRLFEEELSREGSRVTVLEESERVLGYGVLRIVFSEAQILDLAVLPGACRRGHGGRLLGHMLQAAKGSACVKVTLEVSVSNEPALGLYRAAGFQEVGRRKGFYPDGSDALLMDRRLSG